MIIKLNEEVSFLDGLFSISLREGNFIISVELKSKNHVIFEKRLLYLKDQQTRIKILNSIENDLHEVGNQFKNLMIYNSDKHTQHLRDFCNCPKTNKKHQLLEELEKEQVQKFWENYYKTESEKLK